MSVCVVLVSSVIDYLSFIRLLIFGKSFDLYFLQLSPVKCVLFESVIT